ncbi:NAD-dependent epimerase/dehydratase family protein [Spirillospora sp. NBC_00431]
MRTILVTGGSGFLGRHLIASLLDEAPLSLVVIDDLSTGRHPDLWLDATAIGSSANVYTTSSGSRITFLLTDVIDALSPGNVLPVRGYVDEVYHLAARVGGRMALEQRPDQIARNLCIDAAFFSWAMANHARIGRVLYLSSSAVYPLSLQQFGSCIPLAESVTDELSSFETDGVYGWAKLTGEFLAQTVASKKGLNVACVRPFSGYGPDQEADYPVTAIANRVLARENPLLVWGPGDQERDFIHISDCVKGIRLAIERINDGSAVNLGTGIGTSMTEIARDLAHLSGYSPQIINDSTKPVGAGARIADTALMSCLLAWHPKVSLRDGLADVLKVKSEYF